MRVNQHTHLNKLKAPIQAVSERAWVALMRVCIRSRRAAVGMSEVEND
jgi:hypothetical protein